MIDPSTASLRPRRGARITRRHRHGFTLLELLVVLVILSLIAAIAAPQVTKHLRKAKTDTARLQIDALSAAVDTFLLDTGRLPGAEEGLAALMTSPEGTAGWNGPYLKKRQSLIDPWGSPYRYDIPGRQARDYDLYSWGADRREGGTGDAADIGNW
jgi:general secretion pathway protein G